MCYNKDIKKERRMKTVEKNKITEKGCASCKECYKCALQKLEKGELSLK